MKFIRGTTPSIEITVKTQINLQLVSEVWIFISQMNKVKVDKKIEDVTFDYVNRKMNLKLTQDDTLSLSDGDAFFQIRMLLNDGTALATEAEKIIISKIYKEGVISTLEE